MIKILLLILFAYLFTYCILVLFTWGLKKNYVSTAANPFNLPSALWPLQKYRLVYSMCVIRFTSLTTEEQIPQYEAPVVVYTYHQVKGVGMV